MQSIPLCAEAVDPNQQGDDDHHKDPAIIHAWSGQLHLENVWLLFHCKGPEI